MSFVQSRSLALQAALDLRTASLAALLGVFALVGTLGHDPWKQDDAYVFGVVFHMLRTGDWVVPTLGGVPFMEKPPLYYIVAAGCARLFSPLLPLHDGARLASPLLGLIAAGFTAAAGRALFAPGIGGNIVLFILGAFGFLVHSHTMITDMALLAGFGIAIYGLARSVRQPRFGGAMLGSGIGVGFLSKGLVEPGMMGLALVLLPVAFREWRSRRYLATLAWAALFALPWLLVWPLALYERSHELFLEWFWDNNIGRYFGFSNLGATSEPWYFSETLPWFTLPAGPVALLAIARAVKVRGWRISTGLQIAISLLAGMLLVLATSSSARDVYALPVLLPLAMVAGSSVHAFPPRAARAMVVVTAAIALAVALFAWGVWIHDFVTYDPPQIAFLTRFLPGDFHFATGGAGPAMAVAACVLWGVVTWMSRNRGDWPAQWAANVAFGWIVGMGLLLPWIDEAKSFRGPFDDLADHLEPANCVAGLEIGEGQRGMLEYVADLKTRAVEEAGVTECSLLLVQTSHSGQQPSLPAGEWRHVWHGARNGERTERFALFRRVD